MFGPGIYPTRVSCDFSELPEAEFPSHATVMSLATASNGPEAKKFRFALPTQVVVNDFDFDKKNIKMEEGTDLESSSNGDGSENGLDLRSTEKLSPSGNNNCKREVLSPSPPLSQDSSETSSFGIPTTPGFDFPLAMLFQHANSIMKVCFETR